MRRTVWVVLIWLPLLGSPSRGWGQAKHLTGAPDPTDAPVSAQERPQKQQHDDDHQPTIYGLEIGMTAQQVLDKLGRMPDKRKDEKGEVVVYWRMETGEITQVRFRKDNYVSYISLQYKPFRPTNDFMLRTIAEQRQDDPEFRAEVVQDVTGSGPDVASNKVGIGGTDDKVPVLSSAMPSTTPLAGKDPRWRAEYKSASTYDGERTVWTRTVQIDPRFRTEVGFISSARARLGVRYEEEVEFKYVSVTRTDLKKFDKAMTEKK